MHTDGWRLVELEDGSSSSSDPEEVMSHGSITGFFTHLEYMRLAS